MGSSRKSPRTARTEVSADEGSLENGAHRNGSLRNKSTENSYADVPGPSSSSMNNQQLKVNLQKVSKYA
jgi:hypothetical protein